MDFHQALAAKYGVRHLFGGGFTDALGGAAGSGMLGAGFGAVPGLLANSGVQDSVKNQVGKGWHQVIAPNQFSPEMPTNQFSPEMPTNQFQATAPKINQTDFAPAMQAGMGGFNAGVAGLQSTFGNQNDVAARAGQTISGLQGLYGQQQGLADALLAQSKGQGPNPAQQQFQQNVNQNIAQQAGAIASQRGINPALAGRMAAQQGAAMNQQAAGQSALLQAQQQLAAQQALGQQQQTMGQNLMGQNSVYGTQGNLYGQAAGTAGSIGGLGSQMYGTGVSGSQAQNQLLSQGQLGAQGINAGVAAQNAQLAAQGQGLKAGVAEQNANLAAQGQGIKAGVATGNAAAKSAAIKGLMSGAGGLMGMGGSGGGAGGDAASAAPMAAMAAAHGGEIPEHQALSLAHALMARGGGVPGEAQVEGDDEENDTVPTVLSPKEIVLPRSVTMAEDAPEKAAAFVAHLKGKAGKGGAAGYGKILEKHRDLQKRMAELEALVKRSAS